MDFFCVNPDSMAVFIARNFVAEPKKKDLVSFARVPIAKGYVNENTVSFVKKRQFFIFL